MNQLLHWAVGPPRLLFDRRTLTPSLSGASALHYLARIATPENEKDYIELLKLALRKVSLLRIELSCH
jgi:hypothetical protein